MANKNNGNNGEEGFSLVPVSRASIWARLPLDKKSLADVAGVTYRQVNYWTKKGLIAPSEDCRYNGFALERTLLIKQALDAGLSLRKAAALVEGYFSQQNGEWDFQPLGRREFAEKLTALELELRQIRLSLG